MPIILHIEAETIEELKLQLAKTLGDWPKHPTKVESALKIKINSVEDKPLLITPALGEPSTPKTDPGVKTTLDPQSTVTVETVQEPKAQSTTVVEDNATETSIDYDTVVKPKVLAVSAKHGRSGVEGLLQPFEVTNAKHLKPEQYAALVAAADKLLES